MKNFSKSLFDYSCYFSVFYIITDIISGIDYKYGTIAKVLTAIGFVLVYKLGIFFTGFFKLSYSKVLKFVITTATTSTYLWALNTYYKDILSIGNIKLGGYSVPFLNVPVIFEFNDIIFIYIFIAVILVICCIIIDNLNKRY